MICENWKPVVGYEGRYEVSDLGHVRSLDRKIIVFRENDTAYVKRICGRLLRPGRGANGYPTVALGRGNTCPVHVLVARAFLGPCPNRMEVLHADDDTQNAALSNLSYGTHSQNIKQMWERGRR